MKRCLSVGCIFLVGAGLVGTAPARAALTISAAPSSDVTCSDGLCTTVSDDAVLNVNLLKQLLSQSNLKIESGSAAQDIVVAVEISWSGGNALTLDAYRSLNITAPIAVTGSGGLALLTNDGGSGGSFVIGQRGQVTFAALTNSLSINGKAYTLVGNIATLAADLTAHAGGYYALANSYDASADGTYSSVPVHTGVDGIVEGLGNTISNLTLVPTNGENFGLFSTIKVAGTVRDLAVTALSISGTASYDANVGGLVGNNEGTIIGCYVQGEITAYGDDVGGLASGSSGTISESEASVNISTVTFSAGGLVGLSTGPITNSFARGSVANNGGQGAGSNAGGLLGDSQAEITDSYSSGRVTGSDGVIVGGLIAYAGDGTVVSDSYWDTTTSGTTKSAGGSGLTNSQLQSGLPGGFLPSIWAQRAGWIGGLPYLLVVPN
jgi:hypothetical protein